MALVFGVYRIKQMDTVQPITKNCVFCTFKESENRYFYADDLVLAFHSYKPVHPGHALIIPKRHVERFEELTEAEVNRMMAVIKKVHNATCKVQGTSSYMLWEKNGREAFQTVPHVHFHYVPRPSGEYSSMAFACRHLIVGGFKTPLSLEVLQHEAQRMRDAMTDQHEVSVAATVPA